MVRRRLYQSWHPIGEYPFEAFCHGSWKTVEHLRIRDGSMAMHFKNHAYEIEDTISISNLRIRSRRACLSDCTCFLRPGLDVCILPSHSDKAADEGGIHLEHVDAKISSIERKPHDSGCACRFYVICYRAQEPHSMAKMTLGEEIREVKLENIGILQKLQRKPSEDVYYRWRYSEDCSFMHRAILHRGQFSSDISWLLVASIWKGLGFDVKTVQNKMVYQLLDSDHDMCPPTSLNNVKTINFQIDNEVMKPSNMNFSPVVPVNTFVLNDPMDVDLVHDMKEDKPFPFYNFLDLRRSKRRHVQPERFVSHCDFSKAKPCSFKAETSKKTGLKEEEILPNISCEAGKSHSVCSHFEQVAVENMLHANRDDVDQKFLVAKNMTREVKSGMFNRKQSGKPLVENYQMHKTAAAYKRHVENKGLSTGVSCFKKVPERTTGEENSSSTNHDVSIPCAFPGIPTPVTVKIEPELYERNHLCKKTHANHVKEISKIISRHHSRKRNDVPDKRRREVENRWKATVSHGKKFCKAASRRKIFLSTSEYKEMIERCMKNIESETKREHLPVVDQWEAIKAVNLSSKRWFCNLTSITIDQVEEPELKVMWEEMELSMATFHFLAENQGSHIELSSEVPNLSRDGQSCQHEYKMDEQIGIICQLCGFVSTEIRDISPPFLQRTGWITSKELHNGDKSGTTLTKHGNLDLFQATVSSRDISFSERNDNVWALVPDLKMKLHFHQKKGFEFLWRNIAGSLIPADMQPTLRRTGGCIISHSPGAGKTLLIISFLESYLKLFPGKKPLILAPKTTLYTWCKEFKKWDVSFPVHQIHVRRNYINEIRSQRCRESVGGRRANQVVMHAIDCLEKIQKWHEHPSILLMGYTSFLSLTREDSKHEYRRCMGRILRESPGILILDEGHNPRNTGSRLRKSLMRVNTGFRILLSGTLFQNNFVEYFNTLCLARPSFISEVLEEFDSKFKNRKGKKNVSSLEESKARSMFIENIAKKINSRVAEVRKHGLDMLMSITKGFIDVYEGGKLDGLPDLQTYTLSLKPTSIQQKVLSKLQDYKDSCRGNPLELDLLITLGSIHPWLIKTVAGAGKYLSSEELENLAENRVDVNKGPKLRFVVSLVHGCSSKREKVLIFCHNIAPINFLVEIFERFFGWKAGEQVLVLKGDQELFERARVMDQFEEPGGASRLLLASITACAEGISLTAASRVVLLDSEWNPSKTKQAIARAFRPGQERVVYVYQLLASGTWEEEKYGKTIYKEWVSSMIFNGALVEDPSCRQTQNIDDDVLRQIVEDDAKLFHQITKHEKLFNAFVSST